MTSLEQNPTRKRYGNTRKDIETSEICGCFFCFKTFSPSTITKWTINEREAICPFCQLNTVIGDKSGFLIDKKFLKAMHRVWF